MEPHHSVPHGANLHGESALCRVNIFNPQQHLTTAKQIQQRREGMEKEKEWGF